MTKPAVNQVEAQQIMSRNRFPYNKRREWIIWGARHQACSECKALPNQPCFNLSDLRRIQRSQLAPGFGRYNRMPHDARIDWARIIQGLYKRGYK